VKSLAAAFAFLALTGAVGACDLGSEGGTSDPGDSTTGTDEQPEPPPEPAPPPDDPGDPGEPGDPGDPGGDDDCTLQPPPPGRFPAPQTDVVPSVGTNTTFDVATWNIENFTVEDDTPRLVADLIASLALDFVAVQEVVDEDAFDELVERLPGYDGVLADIGAFHNLGFIYRADLATVTNPTVWFRDDRFGFPREPFGVTVTVNPCSDQSFDFVAITVHLKAGRGGEDADRRLAANLALEELTRELVETVDEDVLLLGDFNDRLTTNGGREVMEPWLDSPRYRMQTLAAEADDFYSFVPSRVFYDHIITTVGLDAETAGNVGFVAQLDRQYGQYVDRVSDHLPVVIRLPLPE